MNDTDTNKSDFPNSPHAFRPILFREMSRMITNLEKNGWSFALMQDDLKQRYGEIFDVSPEVFRFRFLRAKERYLAQKEQPQPASIPAQAAKPAVSPDESPEKIKQDQQTNDREKNRPLSWEERRTAHFPGSQSIVRHRSKPRKEDLL
ncbi:hypothetical protein [Acetobacter malorum]|uniref:hypothetical protein n=1 Tax=Acetobacter malorum TaxID=178901 RepID=UPI001E33C8EB|nr:hypothetical protein [Acetobacter malorum]